MEREALLKSASIPPEDWESCFVTENDKIFRPIYANGQLVKTAKEVFDYWKNEQTTPSPTQPTPQEDADALLIDHEYRLTLLELGVN